MTRPGSGNVIYLPPGVMPPQAQQAQQAPASTPGVPFDRNFFENVLPQSVDQFCKQAECGNPVVELHTVDGTRHFLKGVSGVSDGYVALHTHSEHHEQPVQVFLPYQTIYRVEIHPEEDEKQGRMGFIAPGAS